VVAASRAAGLITREMILAVQPVARRAGGVVASAILVGVVERGNGQRRHSVLVLVVGVVAAGEAGMPQRSVLLRYVLML
jgi:hypothetical protein